MVTWLRCGNRLEVDDGNSARMSDLFCSASDCGSGIRMTSKEYLTDAAQIVSIIHGKPQYADKPISHEIMVSILPQAFYL